MKQFNLQEYLENPNRQIVTRDGKNVRIICTNRLDELYPIIALVNNDGVEISYDYTACGKLYTYQDDDSDLFFVPKKREGWINVRKYQNNTYISGTIYDTEKEAKLAGSRVPTHVATIKIEWEE